MALTKSVQKTFVITYIHSFIYLFRDIDTVGSTN